MPNPERVIVRRGVVLWRSGPLACTCTHRPDQIIEIRLLVNDVEIDRAAFPDADSAAAYAITRMHAYNAC